MARSPRPPDRPPLPGRRGVVLRCSSRRRSRGVPPGAPRTPARRPRSWGRASASPSAASRPPRRGPGGSAADRTAAARGTSRRRPSARLRAAGSRDVAVASVEGIAERSLLERRDDLADAVGYGHERLEAELRADLLEADLVVAGVLLAMHIGDPAALQLLFDLVHEIELAVVLARAPGV